MHRLAIIIATASMLAVAVPLSAQGRTQRADTNAIPDNQRPPAGMCRIWLDNVPADQQPAPTDCATAIRHRPPKGHVVFGEPVQAPKIERRATPRVDSNALPPIEHYAPPANDRRPHVDSSKKTPPRQVRPPIRRDTSQLMRPHARRVMRIEHR